MIHYGLVISDPAPTLIPLLRVGTTDPTVLNLSGIPQGVLEIYRKKAASRRAFLGKQGASIEDQKSCRLWRFRS